MGKTESLKLIGHGWENFMIERVFHHRVTQSSTEMIFSSYLINKRLRLRKTLCYSVFRGEKCLYTASLGEVEEKISTLSISLSKFGVKTPFPKFVLISS